MNFAKTLELNRKTFTVPKREVENFLKQGAVSNSPVQVGDIITLPDEISEENGTLSMRIINGNSFFQITAVRGDTFDENEESVNITVNSLLRVYFNRQTKEVITPLDLLEDETDKENSLFRLFQGKTKEELLQFIQGRSLVLKGQETKEAQFNGETIPITVNAFVLLD